MGSGEVGRLGRTMSQDPRLLAHSVELSDDVRPRFPTSPPPRFPTVTPITSSNARPPRDAPSVTFTPRRCLWSGPAPYGGMKPLNGLHATLDSTPRFPRQRSSALVLHQRTNPSRWSIARSRFCTRRHDWRRYRSRTTRQSEACARGQEP